MSTTRRSSSILPLVTRTTFSISFEKEDTNKLYIDSIVEERNLTKGFYKLYHETRLMILKEFKESELENEICLHYAQLFLNRLMFIFFAEDTDLLDKRYFESKIYGGELLSICVV